MAKERLVGYVQHRIQELFPEGKLSDKQMFCLEHLVELALEVSPSVAYRTPSVVAALVTEEVVKSETFPPEALYPEFAASMAKRELDYVRAGRGLSKFRIYGIRAKSAARRAKNRLAKLLVRA